MNTRILLRSQKNEIKDLVSMKGFDPSDFSWSEARSDLDPDRVVSRILRIHTDFFFTFEMKGEAHFSIFCPARHSYVGTDFPGTWDNQKKCFSTWLEYLEKELNEPDHWASENPEGTDRGAPLDQTYITAEPTIKSPTPDLISSRIDRLFDSGIKIERTRLRQNVIQSHIKRYYGKA